MMRAVKWLVSRSAAALFLDPGMGKTSCTYAAVLTLKKKGLAKGALIVAPRRPAVSVWPAEREKWSDFHALSVGLLHGPKKEQVLKESHDVFVITYDGLRWLFGSPPPNYKAEPDLTLRAQMKAEYAEERKAVEARLKRLFSMVDIIVFDELSKLKHKKTGRHKTLALVLHRFSRRWGLTGSPAANGLENLFGQIYALDLGKAFGPYITHFRAQFFQEIKKHPNDPYPTLALQPGGEKAIHSRLKDIALRLDATDYLTLPKVVYVPMRFELPDEHRAQYEDMERDMVLALGSGEVFTARAAATASMKCRQITSGAIYHDKIDPLTGLPSTGARKYTVLHNEKIQMCEDLIEELQGQQLLIAYEFHHELERLVKALGKDTPFIGRGVSDKAALRYEKEWNDGTLPYLAAHPASIGHGLNLQGSSAHHILWISGTWDFELWDQFIRRLLRSGSTAERIFVYMFIARDTVDESVYNDKHRKGRTQTSLLSVLKPR
jgi:SNF2 family DNA or RNA helicase